MTTLITISYFGFVAGFAILLRYYFLSQKDLKVLNRVLKSYLTTLDDSNRWLIYLDAQKSSLKALQDELHWSYSKSRLSKSEHDFLLGHVSNVLANALLIQDSIRTNLEKGKEYACTED